MILTEGLSKAFDQFLAVDNVNLQVKAGEVLALLGPNGAGKTTTVRMLTSILRPTHGWAQVAGFDVVKQSSQVRAAVGVLTEQHGLYSRMPGREYLDFFGEIYNLPPKVRRERTTSLLEQFGLDPSEKKPIGEYSKGMRQKLALARALLHNPPVLLLDEPTSAMDPESSRLVRDAIHSMRSANRAIIICTHNLPEAEELADQIAIIRQGRIILQGTLSMLKRSLLGPPEYEARLGETTKDAASAVAELIELSGQGDGWLRFRTTTPQETNPKILQCLLSNDIPVISLHEINRSLEKVYLQAINASPDDGVWRDV
jgi:ABC-2 type transport system ATP-binding protein